MVTALCQHCKDLEILRIGGSSLYTRQESNQVARAICRRLPRLDTREEDLETEDWESIESTKQVIYSPVYQEIMPEFKISWAKTAEELSGCNKNQD